MTLLEHNNHNHEWNLPVGPFMVIDTLPEQYPYVCVCGAFTHNPETGVPCQTCAPMDYAQRGPTVRLRGGPLDGSEIPLPINRSVHLRVDPSDKRVQKYVTYQATDNMGVWEFQSNDWTHPFEPRT